jgi:hypothetical protein
VSKPLSDNAIKLPQLCNQAKAADLEILPAELNVKVTSSHV